MEQDVSQQILAELKELRQGQQGLEQRVDTMYEEQMAQGSRLARLTDIVELIREDVDGIRADVDGIREDVDGIHEDMDSIHEDVDSIREDVDSIRANVASIEVGQHEIKKMLKDDKVYHQELVKKHGPRIEALENTSEQHTADIAFLKQVKAAK